MTSPYIPSLVSLCFERFLDTALIAALQRKTRAQQIAADEVDVNEDETCNPRPHAAEDGNLVFSNVRMTSEIAECLLAFLSNSVLFDERIANAIFIRRDVQSHNEVNSSSAPGPSSGGEQCLTASDVCSLRIVHDEYRIKRIAKALQRFVHTCKITSLDCQANEFPMVTLHQLTESSRNTLRILRFCNTDFYEETRAIDDDTDAEGSRSGDEDRDSGEESSYPACFSDDEAKDSRPVSFSQRSYRQARARARLGESIGSHLAAFSRLSVLSVRYTDLTDKDLAQICSHLQLKVLDVAFCSALTDLSPLGLLADSLHELSVNHVPLLQGARKLRTLYRLVRLDVAIHGEPFNRKPHAAAINVLLGGSESMAYASTDGDSDSESDWEDGKQLGSDLSSDSDDDARWMLLPRRRNEEVNRRHQLKRLRRETCKPSAESCSASASATSPDHNETEAEEQDLEITSFWPHIRHIDLSGWQTLSFPVFESFVRSHGTLRRVSIVNAGSAVDSPRYEALRSDSKLRHIVGLTQSLTVARINLALRDKRLLLDERAAFEQLYNVMQILPYQDRLTNDQHLVPSLLDSLLLVTRTHIDRPAVVMVSVRILFTILVDFFVRIDDESLATRLLELLVTVLERIEYGRSPVDYVNTLVQHCMRILYRSVVYGHTVPSNDSWYYRTVSVVVKATAYNFNMNRQILGMDSLCTLNYLTQKWKRMAPLNFVLKQESSRAMVEKMMLALSAAVSEFADSVVQADEMAGELHNGLRAALSTLTRLTDENPLACQLFAIYTLPVHMRFVRMCTSRQAVRGRGHHRVLAIAYHHESFLFSINNMAEVASLRRYFTPKQVETVCNDLLHPSFEIVYHACSILANVLSTMRDEPHLACRFDTTLAQFERGVERLDTMLRNSEPIGIFHTLNPIYKMVDQSIEAVQYFACWTIEYLVQRDADRYILMLIRENARSNLQRLVLDQQETSERCKMKAFYIIDRIDDFSATDDDVSQ